MTRDDNIWTSKFARDTNFLQKPPLKRDVCIVVNNTLISKRDSRAICTNSKSHGRLKKQKGMFADLWAGPNVQPPFNKGQGGSSKNEGLIVCVFAGPPLFRA